MQIAKIIVNDNIEVVLEIICLTCKENITHTETDHTRVTTNLSSSAKLSISKIQVSGNSLRITKDCGCEANPIVCGMLVLTGIPGTRTAPKLANCKYTGTAMYSIENAIYDLKLSGHTL